MHFGVLKSFGLIALAAGFYILPHNGSSCSHHYLHVLLGLPGKPLKTALGIECDNPVLGGFDMQRAPHIEL